MVDCMEKRDADVQTIQTGITERNPATHRITQEDLRPVERLPASASRGKGERYPGTASIKRRAKVFQRFIDWMKHREGPEPDDTNVSEDEEPAAAAGNLPEAAEVEL